MNLSHLSFGSLISFGVLVLALAMSIIISIWFFVNRSKPKSNFFLGLLLLLMGVTLLHHFCILLDIYEDYPKWLFLPIYYTLWFGPVLFFAIKLRLFPAYRLRFSDLKHGILPFGQLAYFIYLFNCSIEFRQELGRSFFSPFYGAMEMTLYIGTFYAYLYSAYRYAKQKEKLLTKRNKSHLLSEVIVLKNILKVLLILFWINSGYIIADFVMYEFLNVNLHTLRGFTRMGDISFGLMVIWMSWGSGRMLMKGY